MPARDGCTQGNGREYGVGIRLEQNNLAENPEKTCSARYGQTTVVPGNTYEIKILEECTQLRESGDMRVYAGRLLS